MAGGQTHGLARGDGGSWEVHRSRPHTGNTDTVGGVHSKHVDKVVGHWEEWAADGKQGRRQAVGEAQGVGRAMTE